MPPSKVKMLKYRPKQQTLVHPDLPYHELDMPQVPKKVRQAYRQRKKKMAENPSLAGIDKSNSGNYEGESGNNSPSPANNLAAPSISISRSAPGLAAMEASVEGEEASRKQVARAIRRITRLAPADKDGHFFLKHFIDQQGDNTEKKLEIAAEIEGLLLERLRIINKAQEARKLELDRKCIFTKSANEARANSQLTAEVNRGHALKEIVQQVQFNRAPPINRRAKRSVLPGLDDKYHPMALLEVYRNFQSKYCEDEEEEDGDDDDKVLRRSESASQLSEKNSKLSRLRKKGGARKGNGVKLQALENLKKDALKDFLNAPMRSPSHVKRRRQRGEGNGNASDCSCVGFGQSGQLQKRSNAVEVKVTEWKGGELIAEKISKINIHEEKDEAKDKEQTPATKGSKLQQRNDRAPSELCIRIEGNQARSDLSTIHEKAVESLYKRMPKDFVPKKKEENQPTDGVYDDAMSDITSLNDFSTETIASSLLDNGINTPTLHSTKARVIKKATESMIHHSSENPTYMHIRSHRRQAYEAAKGRGTDPALFSVAQSVFYERAGDLASLSRDLRKDLPMRQRDLTTQNRLKEAWDCLDVPILLRLDFRLLLSERVKQSNEKAKQSYAEEEMTRIFESAADSIYFHYLLKAVHNILAGQPNAPVTPLPEDVATYLTLVQAYRSPKPQEVMLEWVTDLLKMLKERCMTFIEKIVKYTEEGKTKNQHVQTVMTCFIADLRGRIE